MAKIDLKTSSPIITSVCIYYLSSPAEGVTYGSIVTPVMVRTTEGKIVFRCIEPARSYGGWYIDDQFFAINPMYRFIPYGTSLICVAQNEAWPYNTTDVSRVYDMFHPSPTCSYFITWTLPVPYTTPLYIFKKGNNTMPSFDKKPPDPGWEEILISPLFVLLKEPRKTTILPEKKWFKMKDGFPQFRFKNYFGRCIPDPDGTILEDCTVEHNEKNILPTSLLQYLKEEEQMKTKARDIVPKFLKKSRPIYVSIILVVFLAVLLGIIIFLFSKNKNESGTRYRR